MNYIDVVVLLFLVWGAVRGFSKGLIIEIATFVGLILGVYLAIDYSPQVEKILQDFLNISSRYMAYIALAVTFLLVVIAVFVIGKLLTKLMDVIALGWMNKCLGMLLGAMKYAVVVGVLLLVVDVLNEKFHFIDEETRQDSLFFQPFLNFAQKIYNMIRF